MSQTIFNINYGVVYQSQVYHRETISVPSDIDVSQFCRKILTQLNRTNEPEPTLWLFNSAKVFGYTGPLLDIEREQVNSTDLLSTIEGIEDERMFRVAVELPREFRVSCDYSNTD